MATIYTIWKKELNGYFNTPSAYIIIISYLLFTGFLFFLPFFANNMTTMRAFFSINPFMCLFLCPAATMRLFSEERKSGSFELLMTLPVSDWQVIAGKFLAAFGILLSALFMTIPYSISISFIGELDPGPVISGYLGLLFICGALLAIGMYTSSITNNQVVAFVAAVSISSVFVFIDRLVPFVPSSIAVFFKYISLTQQYASSIKGVLTTSHVAYCLSITSLFLALTHRSLESRRWK